MLGGHATPANRSDTEEFVTVLDEVGIRAGESVYADKGYSSQLNRYVLAVRGLSGGIMHKAPQGCICGLSLVRNINFRAGLNSRRCLNKHCFHFSAVLP